MFSSAYINSEDNPFLFIDSNAQKMVSVLTENSDLFNSDNEDNLEKEFTSFDRSEDRSVDEDDLEIPAFLRRQKN